MDQLLNMGFPPDLASQALSATGNTSPQAAVDYILSQSSPKNTTSSPTPPLHPFFLLKKHSPTTPKNSQPEPEPTKTKVDSTRVQRKRPRLAAPLADRMRPASLDLLVGQAHLLGPTSILRGQLLPSIILWGPPGSGKTSLARTLESNSGFRFVAISAVTAGVKDLRDSIEAARAARKSGRQTLLFVDEIHRFSKAQQDSFLPAIEDGSIVLVGATTENPSFQLTTPLLSRCRVLALQPLGPEDVAILLRRAVGDSERGVVVTTGRPVSVSDDAVEFLSRNCDGDARVALNALEIAATLAANKAKTKDVDEKEGNVVIEVEDAKEAMQCKHLAYDRAGDEHYNLISALHKSMRGSDVDASIYWLARMLEGGEQPLYIARRLVRFASEDVGLADPAALGHAVACYQACHFLGMPECDVCLAQCVAYLALAPKSVAVYKALGETKRVIRESAGGNEGVPLHLRNAPTKLMKDIGYGKDYLYPPDHEDCSSQTYLPPSLQGRKFLDWPPYPGKLQ